MARCETGLLVALALMFVGLLISVSLNAILYWLRRRDAQRTVIEAYPYPEPEADHMDSPEVLFEQENPIYGNINPDMAGAGRAGEGGGSFYEHLTTHSREEMPPEPEVAYSSLDLAAVQKRREKHRNSRNPKPGQNQNRARNPSQQEPGMPCRNSSPMTSHHSIYLNSHQVAMESEELERRLEREREDLMDFDNVHNDPARFFTGANQSQAFETDRGLP